MKLSDRLAMVTAAFIRYVNDTHKNSLVIAGKNQSPRVLGLCQGCGYPLYKSEYGGGIFHYSFNRLDCRKPTLPQKGKKKKD